MTNPPFETVIAWARYLSWSDAHRRRFDAYFEEEGEASSTEAIAHWLLHIAQWYASLWVVVEGWRTLGVQDRFITALLDNPHGYADLLRRCRNGVYHFQPTILEPKLSAILARTESLRWCHALHHEFNRWLWLYPEQFAPMEAVASGLRTELRTILGWLPDNSPWAHVTEAQLLASEASNRLGSDAGPDSTPLREALANLQTENLRLQRGLIADQQLYLDPDWLTTGPSPSAAI